MNSTPTSKAIEPQDALIARADERLAHAHEQIARADEELTRLSEQVAKMEREAAHPRSAEPGPSPEPGPQSPPRRPALRALVGLPLAAGIVVALHTQQAGGFLGDNVILKDGLNVLYWLVPHQLTSDAPRELLKTELELFSSPDQGSADIARAVAAVPGASGASDILWWAFVVAVMATLVYIAVRRRQV